ncbi:cytochrome c biogenesis protein/redoxin [Novisyntrophococcus fermenticellae]|uniref:cytochrome c biogenesis protein/redoxin n=1 Tax=Novisyntrophococcus fermenticellae TaxID=2068655 RepID=UPI001E47EB19|nr:cytochrome c biogenesis protein CcdA [Novisyntrophococcus fermenticellae]
MGFSLDVSVPVLTVFLQGLLSFFSPCVLPLIPLYIGYLSGGTHVVGEDGRISYQRSKVMLNTFFFVLGVSAAFFLLGMGVSAAGRFFNSNQMLFARIGGILVILFGLYQLGIFGKSDMLGKEHRLPIKMNTMAMSPWVALLMGFTFSFAWTPCVGPALASVLLMTASAGTKAMGFLLIGVYTLGFVLPFLAVGLFTSTLLDLFKKHGKVVRYTVKIGGILMVLMGIMMFTGNMNSITGYLSKVSTATSPEKKEEQSSSAETKPSAQSNSSAEEQQELPDSYDFTLTDQYGNSHTLSEYKGKTVFLNFWATWCPPCRAEMPDIQKIYEETSAEGKEELVVLGIAAPDYGKETSEDGILQFLDENGYTYPVLMDPGGKIFAEYGVYSYPTTFMINKEGKVFGYVSGQISEDTMRSIIKQTMEGKR